MATFDYQELRDETLALLQEFGKPVTLHRESELTDYDPVAGKFPVLPVIELNGTGVLVGFNKAELADGAVQATDRKLLYQGDALAINDKYGAYRVIGYNDIDPDESGTILTIAHLRK